jgi:hypothetical protein
LTRGSNTRFRREVFELHRKTDARGVYMLCGRCGCRINPAVDRWTADHDNALANGGQNNAATNGQPLCKFCDDAKTHKEDQPKIAKSKRVSAKHFGVKTKAGFRKPPPGFKYDWSRGGLVRVDQDE